MLIKKVHCRYFGKAYKLIPFIAALLITLASTAQNSYKDLEAARSNADKVTVLNLRKYRKAHPDTFLGEFKNLEVVDLTGTQLEKFPLTLCQLEKLRVIKLGDNDIDTIPDCICNLPLLEVIELWDNNIYGFPDCLTEITSLKSLDLIGIRYNFTEYDRLRRRFPHVPFKLSDPCDCTFGPREDAQ